MNRAYSLLQIKALDEDERVITGIASTAEADRMGDVVEPEGAEFKLPIPFLWQHNAREPIGEVFAAKVTKNGIEIKARIAKVDEPGTLKNRLDEAWQSMKSGLVKGLSIGFQPIESARIDNTYGLRFLKWLWLELSAVTIPANGGAFVSSIKSIADLDRAALGVGLDGVTSNSAGVSAVVVRASKDARNAMKTFTEQISAFEATRQAKSARMTELMTKAGETGETLDATQSEEYDGLETEIKAIDAHLVRLNVMEQTNKAAAVVVNGKNPTDAAASRGGVVVVPERLEKGIEFARYAMCLGAAKGNTTQALEIAKNRFPTMQRIHTVLKAAVGAGTTTDPTWAGALVDYTNLATEFIEFLRPQTILGKFGTNGIPSLTRIPFNVRIIGQTSGGDGYWVGQGQNKPLTQFDVAPVTHGWAKVANIAVLTDELVRFSSPSAEMLVRQELAKALIARLDTDFVDPTKAAVANVSPASITNGVTPIPTVGSSEADVSVDIENLFAPFIAAHNPLSSGVWIMSTVTALRLMLMKNALGQPVYPTITMMGGTFMGLPVIVSEYVANQGSPSNDLVILLNAVDIYLSDDGQVTIDASREASLEMSNTPTGTSAALGSPYAPTATSLVSLWQSNSIGIKAERYINWSKRRSTAVQYMTNVIWGRGGGSPA